MKTAIEVAFDNRKAEYRKVIKMSLEDILYLIFKRDVDATSTLQEAAWIAAKLEILEAMVAEERNRIIQATLKQMIEGG